MEWLRFLFNLSLLISVSVDVIVLCHVFPAFRRTKNKAFLFIAIASVLGIVDTVWDHMAASQRMGDPGYVILRTLRRLAYFADCIFWCAGIVLLARPYLAEQQVSSVQPSAAPNVGPAVGTGDSGLSGRPPSIT
jgi:hypothetical protein